MKLQKTKLLICLLAILLSIPCISSGQVFTDTKLNYLNDLIIGGPADKYMAAEVVGAVGQSEANVCQSTAANYNLTKVTMESVIPSKNRSFSKPSYPTLYLFDAGGDPGFAVVPMYASGFFNAELPKVPLGGLSASIRPGQFTVWNGYRDNATRITRNRDFMDRALYYIYKDMGRPEKGFTIPAQILYQYKCWDGDTLKEVNTISMPSVNVKIQVSTCAPASSTAVVQLNPVLISDIKDKSSTTLIGAKSRTFSLTCQQGIRLYYSLVDIKNPTNTTQILGLDPAQSTAQGVGFAVANGSGTLLNFGPDGSTKPNPDYPDGRTQYEIGYVFTEGKVMTHTLNFGYVRDPSKGDVKKGKAVGIIGITYSYQ